MMENLELIHTAVGSGKPKKLQAAISSIVSLSDDARSLSSSIVSNLLTSIEYGRLNAFHLAAEEGDISMMEWVIHFNGGLSFLPDQSGDTPLHYAVENNHLPMVEYLIQQGHPMDISNLADATPFHLAVIFQNLPIASFLLQAWIQNPTETSILSWLGEEQRMPLHLACWNGDMEMVELLLTLADQIGHVFDWVKYRTEYGHTILHDVVVGGKMAILDRVMTHLKISGDDLRPLLSEVNITNSTPIQLGINMGRTEMVARLLELTPIPEDPDDLISRAVLYDSVSMVQEILQFITGPNWMDEVEPGYSKLAQSADKRLLLHSVVKYDHPETIRYLVGIGCRGLHLLDSRGQVPFYEAVIGGKIERMIELIRLGSPEVWDDCLPIAIQYHDLSTARFLVALGATGNSESLLLQEEEILSVRHQVYFEISLVQRLLQFLPV